jgi:hypothetical protein
VLAPNLVGIIDVIAIPRLTLLFGTRLLHFGAFAAAKACHEKSKRADNFQAGEYLFHIFLVPDALKSIPAKFLTSCCQTKLWISSHEIDQDEMLDGRTIVPSSGLSQAALSR